MNKREQLINWINLYSIEQGEEFTLASGQKSSVYLDLKKTVQSHRVHKLLAELLVDKIEKEFAPISAVCGVVLGGCHLASIVAMQYPIGLDVLFIRNQPKDHGSQKWIERPYSVQGSEVVILEDVITTGGSACAAAKLLEKEGFEVKGILAIVDRREVKTDYIKNFKVASLIDFEELTI